MPRAVVPLGPKQFLISPKLFYNIYILYKNASPKPPPVHELAVGCNDAGHGRAGERLVGVVSPVEEGIGHFVAFGAHENFGSRSGTPRPSWNKSVFVKRRSSELLGRVLP